MKKTLKHILSLIFLIALFYNASAQFVSQTLTLLPTSPTNTNIIKVVSSNQFNSAGCSLTSSSVNSFNFQIYVVAYHYVGIQSSLCYTKDTVTLGNFSLGNYKLLYTIKHTVDSSYLGKDSLYFTITGPNGVKETEALQHLKLYPNPVKDVLTIETESQGIAEGLDYKLFNVVGQEVIIAKIKEHNKQAINLKELPAGIYFIRFNYKGQSLTKKIIKE